MPRPRTRVGRRQFLKRVGATAGLLAAGPLAGSEVSKPGKGGNGLALVLDPSDGVASSSPTRSAVDLFRRTCESHGVATRLCRRVEELRPNEPCVLVAGRGTSLAREALGRAGGAAVDAPESLALLPTRVRDRVVLLATAPDALGLAYALTELADRVACGAEPRDAVRATANTVDRPTCRIRSVMRLFVSDVEDGAWFHDRSFWPSYLDMLVSQRFNRFHLAFGIGYDFARQLRDTYFYFPYPFLLSVPGYDVRAVGLGDAERDRNLATLRYVTEQAAQRGLHFQLGLWTHAFEWTDSPEVNYTISGLDRENHAAYCRDAVRALLLACPAIKGLTIRTHGESGVPEGDEGRYEFWRTVFSGIVRADRPVEIDLHAKGVDQRMVDLARATGLPLRVSPKFWAEHMGLPYLQSSIRDLELPRDEPGTDRLMALSTGTRNHMRYSYGDLLVKNRPYGILHRVWPGTQRLLLWGDPVYAAAMGRAFSAFDADGVEFMEPLSFKGRKGSGLAGGRDAYLDTSLRTDGDWRKYEYTYRLWGRLAYDPACDPVVWRRSLRHEFGAAAEKVESGLAQASRILPLVSSVHCPSAANNNYWPEMYSDMSLVDGVNRGSYSDTPTPRVFGTVSSLDPRLFASVDECAEILLQGGPLVRIAPTEVARQLEGWSASSTAALAKAKAEVADPRDPRYRRVAVDGAIAAGIGLFFAGKFRAGVLFAIFDRTGDLRARDEALRQYRGARRAWADFAAGAATAYVRDVTFGFDPHLRGHWQDRLPAIDRNIAALQTWEPRRWGTSVGADVVAAAIAAVLDPRPRPSVRVEHAPLASFAAGRPLLVEAGVPAGATSVRLCYRHLNQAETPEAAEMERTGGSWRTSVPAEYTNTLYPLQYSFEVRSVDGVALWPGFGPDFTGTPYFVSQPA